VERDGMEIEQADERGGEHVLPGVLLHVVTPARGVNLAADEGSGLHILYRRFEVVDDLAVFGVSDFGDPHLGRVVRIASKDPSCVEDLSAAGGIKGGTVENQRGTRSFCRLANFGVEVVEERIVVVEARGHGKTFNHRGHEGGFNSYPFPRSEVVRTWLLGWRSRREPAPPFFALCQPTTIHHESGAGDPLRHVAGEKENGVGDVTGGADAP
jgi:hypothetical protein